MYKRQVEACKEILDGLHDSQFPLKVWQTGSGTQTNMNVNEVISNIAALKTNSELGSHQPIHPNDDVNKSQSTNDTFPAAIQISVVNEINKKLVPTIRELTKILDKKSDEWKTTKQEVQASLQEDYLETTLQLLKTQHNISINRPLIDQLTVAQE